MIVFGLATVALSTFTFLLIERPTMHMGVRLRARRRAKPQPV